eukprot:gene24053-biopygen19387
MIRVRAGSSLAFKRLSRDVNHAVLSARTTSGLRLLWRQHTEVQREIIGTITHNIGSRRYLSGAEIGFFLCSGRDKVFFLLRRRSDGVVGVTLGLGVVSYYYFFGRRGQVRVLPIDHRVRRGGRAVSDRLPTALAAGLLRSEAAVRARVVAVKTSSIDRPTQVIGSAVVRRVAIHVRAQQRVWETPEILPAKQFFYRHGRIAGKFCRKNQFL